MSKKRYFDTKFWSDTWIVDTLNPLDRYLYMYLILNEKTNIAGVYELPLRTMANEVGLDKEEVIRMPCLIGQTNQNPKKSEDTVESG